MTIQARLTSCWRYPVKSMQGLDVPELHLDRHGAEGDREWALVLDADGKLASAKRFSTLLMAHADDDGITLPDGEFWSYDDPGASAALSGWLGRSVTLERATPGVQRVYDMTFDPPNDDAEFVEIPAPEGTFHDWAPLHLVVASTVRHCQSRRAGIEWHIRRFRPNLVLDADLAPFAEQDWVGLSVRVGEAELVVTQPTVRCAVPLRAQPGLPRRADLYRALTDLNQAFPNHLGLYLQVKKPGTVRVGDPVEVLGA